MKTSATGKVPLHVHRVDTFSNECGRVSIKQSSYDENFWLQEDIVDQSLEIHSAKHSFQEKIGKFMRMMRTFSIALYVIVLRQ